jgi:type II secretory pathway component PulF
MSSTSSNLLSPAITLDVLKLRIAVQLAPKRWRSGLERVIVDLEAGRSWEEVVARSGRSSASLQALLAAALEAGHPAEITLSVLQRGAGMKHSWQQMITALMYPTIIIIFAQIVGSITGMLLMSIVADNSIFGEDVSRPARDFNDMATGALLMIVWMLVLLVSAYVLASPKAWLKLVGSTPLIGRPYRWLALCELLSRLAIFSRYQPVLPQALRITARSYGTQALSAIAAHVAEDVEQGHGFRSALHHTILSDERAGVSLTVVDMDGQRFGQSLERASQLLEQMTRYTCLRLKLAYPVFALLIIAGVVWSAWASYLTVLALITSSLA